jgi:microtubule-associated protein, RP/EB family
MFVNIKINQLQVTLQQYELQISSLEKERDFYYQKLRDVEMICQEPECETQPYMQKVIDILYATEVRR